MPSSQKYTDEYLKEVLLDKSKELGRSPTRREVKHGNAIAQQFGDGSYDNALIHFGLQPNYSRVNKRKTKKSLKPNLEGLTCIDVYEMVLNSELYQFPKYFWQDISEAELRELLMYFFEKKLTWTIIDIKNNLNTYIFAEYKLGGGMFQTIFDGSPFKVVDFVYPNEIKEWELKCTPLSYWTIDKCIEVTKYLLEKEQWTDKTIRSTPIYELLKRYGLTTVYINYFKGYSYDLINSIYPDRFKPWELPKVPQTYWSIKTATEAIKWMIEDKLKWSEKDIKEKYCLKTFKQFKLEGMLNQVFESSPFKAINMVYPGKFHEQDFNHVPRNYWTKEKAIKAIKVILDELSDDDIKKDISTEFFIENSLRYPYEKYFGKKPFAVLDTIYPGIFNKNDFSKKNK